MTTSLSRQLQRLKTSAPQPGLKDSLFSSGPFILKESRDLDRKQLEYLAKDGLEKMAESNPRFSRFRAHLFDDENDDKMEDEESEDQQFQWQEDLLISLTPVLLTSPAQFVLQWAVSRHKVHETHAESLIIASLPHYSYRVFNLICEAVKIAPSQTYPGWLESFKRACHPATERGLRSHLASDRGFLKLCCDHLMRAKRHEEFRRAWGDDTTGCYSDTTFFFCRHVLLALGDCSSISANQVHDLMRVIVSCLKGENREFFALAASLLAGVLPRVGLKAKVADKLLKVLGKVEKNQETLALHLILFKSQRERIDRDKFMARLVKFSDLFDEMFNQSDKDENDIEYVKKVIQCLALLAQHASKEVNDETVTLFRMIQSGLQSPLVRIEEPTAALLIQSISGGHVALKSKKKPDDTTKKVLKAGKKLLATLRSLYPSIYVEHSLIKNEAADILFLAGIEEPSEGQIAVKKLLMDDQLVSLASRQWIPSNKRDRSSELTRLIKESEQSVKQIFTSVPFSFMAKQLPGEELVKLALNCLELYDGKPDVQKDVLNFVCSQEFAQEKSILEELERNNLKSLELIVFFKVITMEEKISKDISWFMKQSHLERLLEIEDVKARMKEANRTFFTDEKLIAACDEVKDCPFLQSPVNLTILLGAIKSRKVTDDLALRLLNLLEIAHDTMELIETKGVEFSLAKDKRQIPLNTLKTSIDLLESLKSDNDKISLSVLGLACRWKKRFNSELKRNLFKAHDALVGLQDDRQLDYYSTLMGKTFERDGVTYEMKKYCGKQLGHHLEESENASKAFLNFDSEAFLNVLSILEESEKCRRTALAVLEAAVGHAGITNHDFAPLAIALTKDSAELATDLFRLPKIITKFCQKNRKSQTILKALLTLALKSQNSTLMVKILPVLSPLNDLSALAEYGKDILENGEDQDALIAGLLSRFFKSMVVLTEVTSYWEFAKSVFTTDRRLSIAHVERHAGAYALSLLRDHATKIDNAQKMFSFLIDLSVLSLNSDVLTEARNVALEMKLQTGLFIAKLEQIWSEKLSVSDQWRKSVFLLEIFADSGLEKTCQKETVKLIKPLFDLLKQCNLEDESDAYHVDIILSTLLQIITSLSEKDVEKLDESTLNPELLVRCVSTCRNQNTKGSALLVLARASAVNADYVLHNSIPIFTFMGSHFLRLDSRHSFEVACKVIDILVPHIQKAAGNPAAVRETNLGIATTFVDASADMPAHRFKVFLHKVTQKLGEREYLWIVTLLLLGTLGKKKSVGDKKAKRDERLTQILDFYAEFEPRAQIESLLQMMVNLKQDSKPIRKLLRIPEEDNKNVRPIDEFDMLRLKMLNFVAALLSSQRFGNQVLLALHEGDNINQQLSLLIECAILNVDNYEKATNNSKIHSHLLHYCERVMEGSLGILPPQAFISALQDLLANKHELVRRKTLEVFNAKLQQGSQLLLAEGKLISLLEPLICMAKGTVPSSKTEKESQSNQQLALLALRSFARAVGGDNPGEFKAVCIQLTKKSFLTSLTDVHAISATLLCLTETLESIGPHAVACLAAFADWLVKLLSDEEERERMRNDHSYLSSLILAVGKLMENFSGFLNPYYQRFVIAACKLSEIQRDYAKESEEQVKHSGIRIKNLQISIAQGIPTHSLINICGRSFDDLVEQTTCNDDLAAISALVSILKDNISELDKGQALSVSPPFTDFFMQAFTLRSRLPALNVDATEADVIDAFMTLALKLALDDFKPLLYRVLSLVQPELADGEASIYTASTAFHVAAASGDKLRSLFSFAFETLVQKATAVLNSASEDNFAKLKSCKSEETVLAFVGHVLSALSNLFAYNRVESLLAKSFEDHVNAILSFFELSFDQLENGKESFFEKVKECLTHLASSTDDETQWKYLNFQVLLCLRSNDSKNRNCALDLISSFVEVKGETYLAVLPDAVPFLCEALEDEDQELETKCKKLISKMEEVFGQSVESYFE